MRPVVLGRQPQTPTPCPPRFRGSKRSFNQACPRARPSTECVRTLQVLKGLGPKYSEAMSWVILLYLFGSCVAYLIIVGDTFGPLLRHYVVHPWDLPAAFGDRRAIIVFSSTLIILPLSLQRTMGALAGVSSLAVTAMLGTTFVVVGKAVAAFSAGGGGPSLSPGAWLPDGVVLFNWDATAFLAAPVMVFAYHCHVQAVPIFLELTDTPTLNPCAPAAPAADDDSMHGVRMALAPLAGGRAAMSPALAMRRLQGMYDVLAAAYVECTVMYLTVGVVGYLLFPLTAAANILNAFALDDPVMQVWRPQLSSGIFCFLFFLTMVFFLTVES